MRDLEIELTEFRIAACERETASASLHLARLEQRFSEGTDQIIGRARMATSVVVRVLVLGALTRWREKKPTEKQTRFE